MSNLGEMARRARALDGKMQNVPLRELFPPEFMAKHTEFKTLEAMFDKGGLLQREEEDVKSELDSPEWNEFVARHTKFADWREMLGRAGGEFGFRQITDGLVVRRYGTVA